MWVGSLPAAVVLFCISGGMRHWIKNDASFTHIILRVIYPIGHKVCGHDGRGESLFKRWSFWFDWVIRVALASQRPDRFGLKLSSV